MAANFSIFDNLTKERVSAESYSTAEEANHDYYMNEGHTHIGIIPVAPKGTTSRNTIKARTVIGIGDRFNDGKGHIWEVINRLPGGKLDMIDRQRTFFCMRYHREVILWERTA